MANQRTSAFGEAVRVALQSLRTSKLRSFLTLLGIILATTTLIAVMSLIHGMDVYIAEKVSDMGADGFRVVRMAFFGDFDPKRYLEFLRKNPELSREEFEFVKAKATLVKEAAIFVSRTGPLAFDGDKVDGADIQGGTPNLAAVENTQMASGRYLGETDNQRRLMVVVIGHDFKERWFPNVEAVGKTVQVDGRPFQVIGVAKSKGSVFGQTQDSFVTMPAETYFKIYGARKGITYSLVASGHDKLLQAQEEVRVLIRAYRKLTPGREDNFAVFNSESLSGAWSKMTGAIAATAIAIVSVFMVVGGVVIMNIMLAVVSERTQEIGIRKSLGARQSDILNQFLVESSVLAASGGLLGVIIAWLFAVVIRNVTPVPMAMPMMSVALGVGLSMVVGLFFGIYPARRASKLDPIEALRVER
jgi:putative ABC transport system permease protein